MYAWETLNLYCRYDPRWFETSNRYLPGTEHLAVYRAHLPEDGGCGAAGCGSSPTRRAPRHPSQGWKLHVSAAVGETAEVLHRTLPLLRDSRTPFKFLLDAGSNTMTSGKGLATRFQRQVPHRLPAGRGAVRAGGRSTRCCSGRAERPLHPLRPPVPQVEVGLLPLRRLHRHAADPAQRYGDADDPHAGRHACTRTSGSRTGPRPSGSTDPFFEEDEPEGAELAGGRFTAEVALTFSNQGGVYRGTEVQTGADVVSRKPARTW